MTLRNEPHKVIPPSFRSLSVADAVRAASSRNPEKIAITCEDTHRRYDELVDRIDRISNFLIGGLGLGDGCHGAILAANCLEYLEVVIGAAQSGTPLATLNPRLSAPEIRDICDDAEARILFVDAEREDVARACQFATVERIIVIGQELESELAGTRPCAPGAAVAEWETFTIPYTSGTTGSPKGVLVSHRSRILTMFGMAAEYGCFSCDDRFLAFAPLCHGAGMVFGLAPIFFGGHVEILSRFDPEHVLRRLEAGHMTGVFMVPTHFHGIFGLEKALLDRFEAESLRTIISNAAPLPQATKERIVDLFGDGLLHETYGSTEAGIVTNLRPQDQLRKHSCAGLPFVSTQVKLVREDGGLCHAGEVGELYSLSPYLFNGYWQKPEETEAAFLDGWVSVGDMARRDEEGYIYIVDRKKDMVITGGMNVYPREVEEVLLRHPDVLEAAVVGVADERWGEKLKAYLVWQEGVSIDMDSVRSHCEETLADYKLPKEIVAIPELPKNAFGKILKTELKSPAKL